MHALPRLAITAVMLAAVAAASLAQPAARWIETSHDFGLIHETDGLQTCHMRVVNTGDSALLLLAARTNCGCTASKFTRGPIAPGDTATVTVTYQPLHRPGRFDKKAVITTNVAADPKTTLTIRGQVLASEQTLAADYPERAGSLYLSTRDVVLGPLTSHEHRMGHLTAYNACADTLLLSVTDTPAHIRPRAIPDTLPPGEMSVITIFYDADNAPLWGFNSDTIRLLSTPPDYRHAHADTHSGQAQVNVMAQVKEDFSALTEAERRKAPVAAPRCGDRLDFGRIDRGTTQERTFELGNDGPSPLLLRRLWSPDSGISATADTSVVAPHGHTTVTVKADTTATDTPPLLNATLTVITNDPDAPERQIRLVGEIK